MSDNTRDPVPEGETECPDCGGSLEDHKCGECEAEISKKTCQDYHGMCVRCAWLLTK